MGQALVIHMNPREIECGMCGEIDNHDYPDDRKAVPIWNGEPITSEGECDGYKAVCAKCYNRWNAWDDRMMRSNAEVSGAGTASAGLPGSAAASPEKG